ETAPRLVDRDARTEARDGARDEVAAARRRRGKRRRAEIRRRPDVDVGQNRSSGMPEVRRQDTDDGVPVVVDAQLPSNRGGRSAEAAMPQLVADDDYFGNPGRVV